jgi:cobalt/nickel transport system permease protein
MHIPDGYLSPSTCATLFAAAAPFWYVALRRVKRVMSTSFVPLISVFSAFSFIVMMFNLPLPGGTTGHAVGMGIATVVLGPWAAMLAISIALGIQAIFFGDGGITAIGANCFNMGIAGSLAAYACYRLAGWGSGLRSTRRVVAAGFAGYVGLNVSALLASIEFGVQPLWFHDAAGAPLYCPYPITISIPAMMIGHLTFAGLAEMFISGGVVAYLQRADASLLKLTAPEAPDLPLEETSLRTIRKLWLALGSLLIVTPLGILAAGSAWGEWSVSELAALAPAGAPSGLRSLSNVWAAPISRYAPSFVGNESLGYFLSAFVGVGFIVLLFLLAGLVTKRSPKRTIGFVEKTIHDLVAKTGKSVFAEELANAPGFLQNLDPRVKLAGLLALIVAAVSIQRMTVLAGLFLFAIGIGFVSHVPLRVLALRVWVPVFGFSGVIAAPAIFLVPGQVLYRLPWTGWAMTAEGIWSAARLLLRVETAATFAVLLILCTEWTRVLKALRFFHVPVVVVVILGMTYRYLFLLLKTAQEMFESRQSRLVGPLEGADGRRIASGTVGVLLTRSFQLSAEVHAAMQSRGFHGEVHLLEDLKVQARDWLHLACFAGIAAAAVLLGKS